MIQYLKALLGRASLAFNPRFFGNILYAIVLIAIGLFILYGNQAKYAEDFEDFDHKAFLDFHYIQNPVNIDATGRPMWGKANAPITIVEFSDFECPFCRRAAMNLKPQLKQYQKDVQLYFFNYPLDKSCNPYMPREMHQHACEAAKAALCADQQKKFWAYHDQLFAHQPQFSRDQLKNYARNIGLSPENLETCINSEESKNKILADIEAGKTVPVAGTPTILINGRPVKEWFNPVKLNLVIEEELKRSKKN